MENTNCCLCSGSLKYYKKEDEYIKAIAKLFKKDNDNNKKDIKNE